MTFLQDFFKTIFHCMVGERCNVCFNDVMINEALLAYLIRNDLKEKVTIARFCNFIHRLMNPFN